MTKALDLFRKDFDELRDPIKGKERIKKKLSQYEKDEKEYLSFWYSLSKDNKHVYPSQGLLLTPYDYLNHHSLQMLPQEIIIKTLRMRWFFLEMFNHPYRIHFLLKTNKQRFIPPPKVENSAFKNAFKSGLSLSIGDLGAGIVGSSKERVSRTERYAQGPFIKLGKQARSPFVGSSSPDVWNSSVAVATMAACHCLAGIPRNGILTDIKRQADLAKEVFSLLTQLEEDLLGKREDRKVISSLWRRNVMGTLEADTEKAIRRAEELYNIGVKTFRVYSPEPGTGPIKTTKELKKRFKDIEVVASFIVDVDQAKRAETNGADAVIVGIGGGGRCITGVRSGSVIDWPELVWKLRGKINIPTIVEGGASDHIAVTLLLGASGIAVSRIVTGGTIESPGGALFCSDSSGRLFKPYGGEASARMKYLEGKILPFGIPSFVEGETTKAKLSYIKEVQPTLTYNLHLLNEDAILAMVYRNANDISDLHKINPSPLKRSTSFDLQQRNTH